MIELGFFEWLIGGIVFLITFVYAVTRPFKEQNKKIDTEISSVKSKMYHLHDEVKKETINSNKELTKSINELTTTMKLFQQTFESFKDTLQKQEETNDEFEMRLDTMESDLKDFMHDCQIYRAEKKHFYKDRDSREP